MDVQNFHVTDAEKDFCKTLVRFVIASHLGLTAPRPEKASGLLGEKAGLFVTLKRGGALRGCIGSLDGDAPLVEMLQRMAGAAAFEDPRFPPVGKDEFSDIEVEISLLSPLQRCPDPELIEVGKHGLFVRKTMHSGLLLPQVAVEHGWDRETFLDQTCVKAGLPKGAWKKAKTEIWWFEALVF